MKTRGHTLVDIRTEAEVINDAVDGAINIPMHDVLNRYNEFKTMTEPIIVFCVSGNRSGLVADILNEKGINKFINGSTVENVKNL